MNHKGTEADVPTMIPVIMFTLENSWLHLLKKDAEISLDAHGECTNSGDIDILLATTLR